MDTLRVYSLSSYGEGLPQAQRGAGVPAIAVASTKRLFRVICFLRTISPSMDPNITVRPNIPVAHGFCGKRGASIMPESKVRRDGIATLY